MFSGQIVALAPAAFPSPRTFLCPFLELACESPIAPDQTFHAKRVAMGFCRRFVTSPYTSGGRMGDKAESMATILGRFLMHPMEMTAS